MFVKVDFLYLLLLTGSLDAETGIFASAFDLSEFLLAIKCDNLSDSPSAIARVRRGIPAMSASAK